MWAMESRAVLVVTQQSETAHRDAKASPRNPYVVSEAVGVRIQNYDQEMTFM